MHINDEISVYSEKLSTLIVPSSSKNLPLPMKSNIQMEIEMTQLSNNLNKVVENTLVKHQCQKWQQCFDFDKILKQIRLAEKQHLRSNNDFSSIGKSDVSPSVIFSLTKPSSMSSIKCTHPLRQVQRLNGNDMHYYGIAPKQTALNVIVCNMCLGIYTKVGFNNHMLLQHPSAWNAIATKPLSISYRNEVYNVLVNENNEDFIDDLPGLTVTSEPVESSSDMSGTISNSSNTSSLLSVYSVMQRHKYINNGSVAGSNSSGSSSVRLRSKQTRYKANKAMIKSTNSENNQALNKSSKKMSDLNLLTVATVNPGATSSINESVTPLLSKSHPTAIYSSSSNSSCSLPSTTKMSFKPAEIKSSIIGLESADSSTSNCSSEYDRASSSVSISTKVSNESSFVTTLKPNTTTTTETMKLTVPDRDMASFESCELDQAVSSITRSSESEKKTDVCFKAIDSSIISSPDLFYKQSVVSNYSEKLNSVDATGINVPLVHPSSFVSVEVPQNNEEIMTQNSCEDNSILTLDDVLDSKFINEILSTTESEMHFDVNELEGRPQLQICHQYSTKRMRFDETVIRSQPEHISEVNNNLTVYHHQQNQHTQYNANVDIPPLQQEQNLVAVHAMQTQEFYQQSNLHSYENSSDHGDASTLHPQQQLGENGIINAKHVLDFCSTVDVEHKPNFNSMRDKLLDVTSIPPTNNLYGGVNICYDIVPRQFQIFNIPSLTDDSRGETGVLVHNVINDVHRIPQQHVLPNSDDNLIYEISDSNQLAYCQRQQQMLIDFFHQTNYENIEKVNNATIIQNGRFSTISHPTPSISTIAKIEYDDNVDLKDCEVSLIESVKTFNINSHNCIKDGPKYFDDVYFNVLIYSGIPRPLSINCFGLVKLPFSTAATFRKHLLNSRKANNNPITLSGGLNGTVGSNPRLSHSKSFSSLLNTNCSINSTSNEFSIGSVTITSLTTSHNLPYTQQKQHAISGVGGTVELVLHNSLQSSHVLPGTTLQRQKSKTNGSNSFGNISSSNFTKRQSQANLVPNFSSATPGSRFSSRLNANMLLQNCKAIHINNNTTNGNDKVKYVRNSVFIACKTDVTKNPKYSSRQIVNILGGINKTSLMKCKRPPLSQQKWISSAQNCVAGEQEGLGLVNNFFQHRRKLFGSTINYRKNLIKNH